MCANIFAILSYAFQLAGALLLLLWCIGKCDAKVVKGCFSNHPTPLWMEMDEKGGYTTASKEDLQESVKNVYLNIASFADLVIGYALAIFVTDITIPRWLVLIFVAVVVALLLLAEHFVICKIAKKKYTEDRKVYDDERKPKKGEIVFADVSVVTEDSSKKNE